MAGYHFNPETGEAGLCKAKVSCPFGDLNKDHYTSKEAAAKAYEGTMDSFKVAPLLEPITSLGGSTQSVEVPSVLAQEVAAIDKINSEKVLEFTSHSGAKGKLVVTTDKRGEVLAIPSGDFDDAFGMGKAATYAKHLGAIKLTGHPSLTVLPTGEASSGSLQALVNFIAVSRYSLQKARVVVQREDKNVSLLSVEKSGKKLVLTTGKPITGKPAMTVPKLSDALRAKASRDIPVYLKDDETGEVTPLTAGQLDPERGLVLGLKN